MQVTDDNVISALLPIAQNTDVLVSLQQLINNWHAEEIVDDAKCENVQCKNKTYEILAYNNCLSTGYYCFCFT